MMNTVMQKPSSVGEKRTCPECDVEVVGKEQTSTWQGKTTTKLRWANQDGSWHIYKVGDVFKHQSSSSQKKDSDDKKNQVTTISEEEQANLYDHYGGRLGITDIDNDLWNLAILQVEHQQVDGSKDGAKVAFKWAGLIEIWKTTSKSAVGATEEQNTKYAVVLQMEDDIHALAITQVQKQGGDATRGDVVQSKESKLIDLAKLYRMSAEIGGVAYSSQVLSDVRGASKGSFHTPSAVKDLGSSRQVATLPTPPFFSQETVEDNVRWIRNNYPDFSDEMSANDKVALYMKYAYGIILPQLPIALETITREFRFQSEIKKIDLEQKKREEYMDRQFSTDGTIDRGLLL